MKTKKKIKPQNYKLIRAYSSLFILLFFLVEKKIITNYYDFDIIIMTAKNDNNNILPYPTSITIITKQYSIVIYREEKKCME